MSTPKLKGFSQIPHGFHKRLAELSGNQLKVWLAHRCMEGKEGESYPSLNRLVEYTGLNVHTVTDARKWLRANGWLTSRGQKHTTQGKFSVRVEHTAIPEPAGAKTANREEEAANGTRGKTVSGQSANGKTTNATSGKATNGAGGFAASGETTKEVVPKSFEVDPNEVQPPYLPTGTGMDGGRAGGKNHSETKTTEAGKEELTLTADMMLERLQKAHDKIRESHNDEREGLYDDVPVTPNLTGYKDLFDELRKRGITRAEQMNIVCVAYESWFECKYLASFDAVMEAQEKASDQEWAERRGKSPSGNPIYIPEPIRCPFAVFRKELGVFLDEAQLQLDDSE
jgi:hypothetical protein